MSVWADFWRWPDQRLDDGLGREALVDEERQRRDVEREALGLAGPVEERPTEALQRARRPRASERTVTSTRPSSARNSCGESNAWGAGSAAPFSISAEQPLAQLARAVLAVPVERGRERRVVAPGRGRLLLAELRLRADVRAHRARLVRMRVPLGRLAAPAGAGRLLRLGCARHWVPFQPCPGVGTAQRGAEPRVSVHRIVADSTRPPGPAPGRGSERLRFCRTSRTPAAPRRRVPGHTRSDRESWS